MASLVKRRKVSLEATNHFGDEFSILHASVPLVTYEKMRVKQETNDLRTPARQVAEAFDELGFDIRFIAAGLQMASEQYSTGVDQRVQKLDVPEEQRRVVIF